MAEATENDLGNSVVMVLNSEIQFFKASWNSCVDRADQIEPHSYDESNLDDDDLVDKIPIVPYANLLAALDTNVDIKIMEDNENLLNLHENNASSMDEHEGWRPYESNVPGLDEYNLNSGEEKGTDKIEAKMAEKNYLHFVASSLAFQQQQGKECEGAKVPSTEKQNLISESQMLIFDIFAEFSLHSTMGYDVHKSISLFALDGMSEFLLASSLFVIGSLKSSIMPCYIWKLHNEQWSHMSYSFC
ncbi:hypothetical protein Nepgr_029878 [Nepenthes gracilis]|uniref:Uncharacterized protein n=1 Tax=Nepenthes gracilis TaxID=150966 RepID=A0AAD3Y5B1_NEPGR|nr:hypothetical protein Nepgr_029878 [Nepenthes gracilis]